MALLRLPSLWRVSRPRRAELARALSSVVDAPSPSLASVLEAHRLPPNSVSTTEDPKQLAHRLEFLTHLGIPQGDGMARAIERSPRLLAIDPATVAAPRVQYLLQLGVHEIGKIVCREPQLLECDLDQLHKKIHVLQVLGVTGIARWITRNPAIVRADLESKIKPAVLYLRSIKNLNVGKLLSALPMRYSFAPPDVTAEKVKWFEDELGISDVGTFLSKEPRVLTMSKEKNLQPKIDFLNENGFAEPGALLGKHPKIFTFSLEHSIAPKLKYIVEEMGRSPDDIIKYPQILSHNMYYIKKRHRYLLLHDKFDKHSLGRIYKPADHELAHRLAGGSLLEYAQFGEGAMESLPALLDPAKEPPSRVDKFMKVRSKLLEGDQARLEACEALRSKVSTFLSGGSIDGISGHVGDAAKADVADGTDGGKTAISEIAANASASEAAQSFVENVIRNKQRRSSSSSEKDEAQQ